MVSRVDARLQCHHAVQLNTRVARAYIPAREDDSHTTLTWDRQQRALIGRPFRISGTEMRLGLRIEDLSLVLLRQDGEPARLPLDRLTIADAAEWLARFGVDPEALRRPLHFELEDHPLLHGGQFNLRENQSAFAALAADYAEAASVFEEFRTALDSSPVRCWPHHFDIATLVTKPGGSIGIGMSPGDANYAEPYYYVSPWPYPPVDRLPKLDPPGAWHTDGWVGAVLPSADSADDVKAFVHRAFRVLTQ